MKSLNNEITEIHLPLPYILALFPFQMRDMNHENVNQFVGACVDAPNISVFMLYAQKGSLQVSRSVSSSSPSPGALFLNPSSPTAPLL